MQGCGAIGRAIPSEASPFTVSNGAALAVSTVANTAVLGLSLTLGSMPTHAMSLNFGIQSTWSESVPMLAVSGAITTMGHDGDLSLSPPTCPPSAPIR